MLASVLVAACIGSFQATAGVAAPITAPDVAIDDRTPELTPTTADVATASGELPAAGRDGASAGASEVDLEPFTLVGVSMDAPVDPVLVRVRQQGSWSEWHELHFDTEDAPDGEAAAGRPGVHSAPLWVGRSDGYELLVPAGASAPTVHLARESAVGAAAAPVSTATQPYDGSPGVRSRGSWGARPASAAAEEADDLIVAFVHHSVSTNSYSVGEVPALLRSIQAYHMDVNGWSDIGYNFAVDRFGGIWEAHGGGIINAVIGGHSKGFNTRSVGVVMLGDFQSVAPPAATVNSVAEIIGWRFAVAQTNPRGAVAYTTSTGSTKFPAGTTVWLDRVSGHRDVSLTACPGQLGYATLSAIRSRAIARYDAYAGNVLTRWITSPTHRYTDLHGEAVGGPDVTSTEPGRLDAAARGRDDALWLDSWTGSSWTGWQHLGGILRSGPAIVGAPDGDLDVFVVGLGGGLYSGQLVDGEWSGWRSLGGIITANPDATRVEDGSVVVAGRGMDGATWFRRRSPGGAWGAWTSLGGGQPAGDGPATLGRRTGPVEVFIRGLDGQLWVRRSTTAAATTWGPWIPAGGLLTAAPSAAEPASGEVHVVGRGSDGRLYDGTVTPAGWGGFQRISREATGSGSGMVSWDDDRLDIVTISPDGRLFQTWWTPTEGW